ncbi:MAG: hypothetical protein AAGF07_03620 [Patescibacteria group bacterium]
MSLIIGFFGYLLAFVGLCICVMLIFAFTNILRKSYDSKNALVIVAFISVLFLVNGVFLFFSFSRLASDIRSSSLSFDFNGNFQSNIQPSF